jgi:hypothetical protein
MARTIKMLIRQFKFKRMWANREFGWFAESEMEKTGTYRGFCAAGKRLSDVKEFAALVRWCERTNSIAHLSEMHPKDYRGRWQSTWGGCLYPSWRNRNAKTKA